MLMKNTSDDTLVIAGLDNLVVPPGGVVEIPNGYCQPRPAQNGYKLPPIIEMLAPQLLPADESLVADFKARTLDLVDPHNTGHLSYADVSGLPPAARDMLAETGITPATAPAKAPKAKPTPKQQAMAEAEQAAKDKKPLL